VDVRFYLDPDTHQPDIHGHGVTDEEVEQVPRGPGEDLPAARDSRMKLGQTAAGRYLQVVFAAVMDPDGVFIITAEEAAMSEQWYPSGWDEDRVREVLAHYEDQTDEPFAEIEATREAEGMTPMAVPTELVPEVRALLARKPSA